MCLKELKEVFCARFDLYPAPVLALSSTRIIWSNRMARRLFDRPDRTMSGELFSRLSAAEADVCQVEISGREYVLFSETENGVRLCLLQRMSAEFAEEFSTLLSDYVRKSRMLSKKNTAPCASRVQLQHKYLSELFLQNTNDVRAKGALYALSLVRDLHPARTFAVSAGEMLDFFFARTAAAFEKRGISLSVKSEGGVVALVNFSDFTRGALFVLDFFVSYVLSDAVEVSVARAGDGECVFSFVGEDRYDLLSLYRVMRVRGGKGRPLTQESVLFFPLFCALHIFYEYRHRVEIVRREGKLCLSVYVKTTTALPELVVRREDEESEWAADFLRSAESILFSGDLFSVRSFLERTKETSPEVYSGGAPNLFS